MAKSRRFSRLLQALQGQQHSSSGFGTGADRSEMSGQDAPRSLSTISRRLTAGFRSILGRKTSLPTSDMSENWVVGHDNASLAMEDSQETTEPEKVKQEPGDLPLPSSPEQKTQKRPTEHRHESERGTATPPIIPCKRPMNKTQELMHWANQLSRTEDISDPDNETRRYAPSSPNSDAPHTRDDVANQYESPSPEHSRTAFVSRLANAGASKEKMKRKVARESQSATMSDRKAFESKRRRIYAFRIPSPVAMAHDFPSPRGDLDTTVDNASGTKPDAISKKRWSSTTISTTLTSMPSSETLRGHYKRIPPNFHLPVGSSITTQMPYRPGSIPSACSTAYFSTSVNSPTLASSGETLPLGSNASVTSLGDLVELEQPLQDVSDNEDSMSDVTDHTELSLIEAFEASPTPFHPMLLSVLMSLKEEVVGRIKRRLQMTTLTAHGSWQHPTEQADPRPSSSSGTPPGSTHKTPPGSGSLTSRKRPLDDDDDDIPKRGDGGDDEKRKRKETTSGTQVDKRLKKLACPFYKRYPNSENLHKSCHGPGWQSVHRVKEHIYRRHQRPTYRCTRCLVSFKNEEDLVEHIRAERRCENKTAPPEEETIYISQSQERELRKRRREVPEKERWLNVFRIIFPAVPADQTPSPYYDIDPKRLSSDLATLDEFRAFLVRELPTRIVNDVNNHLRIQPECSRIPGDMTGILRDTIREVLEEFLPSLASQDLHRREVSDACSAAAGSDHGGTGIIQAASLPIDESCVYAAPWPMAASPSSSWQFDSYCDPTDPLAFDLGFDGQFPALGGLPGMQVETDAATPGNAAASWYLGDEFTTGNPFC